MNSLSDDGDFFDWKYIGIEGETRTHVYEAQRMLESMRDITAFYTNTNPRKIHPEDDFIIDFGMTDVELAGLAERFNKDMMAHYDDIPMSEVYGWRTFHDAAVSIARIVIAAESPKSYPKHDTDKDWVDGFVAFDDGRKKNHKTRVYRVPHIESGVIDIVSEVAGMPANELGTDNEYKDDLGLSGNQMITIWMRCNENIVSPYGNIPIKAISEWTSIGDTVCSAVRSLRSRERYRVSRYLNPQRRNSN